MSCRVKSSRNAYQANLARLNAPWIAEHSPELKAARKGTGGAADAGHEGARTGDPSVHLRADGDADVEPGAYLGEFVVPACEQCGGVLKVRGTSDGRRGITSNRLSFKVPILTRDGYKKRPT